MSTSNSLGVSSQWEGKCVPALTVKNTLNNKLLTQNNLHLISNFLQREVALRRLKMFLLQMEREQK